MTVNPAKVVYKLYKSFQRAKNKSAVALFSPSFLQSGLLRVEKVKRRARVGVRGECVNCSWWSDRKANWLRKHPQSKANTGIHSQTAVCVRSSSTAVGFVFQLASVHTVIVSTDQAKPL